MLFAAHYPILRSRTFWNWCLSRLEAENELYRLSRMERERETEWGWIHHKGVTCILYSAIVSSRGRTWQIVCHLLAIVIACHLPKATRTPRCSSRLSAVPTSGPCVHQLLFSPRVPNAFVLLDYTCIFDASMGRWGCTFKTCTGSRGLVRPPERLLPLPPIGKLTQYNYLNIVCHLSTL